MNLTLASNIWLAISYFLIEINILQNHSV